MICKGNVISGSDSNGCIGILGNLQLSVIENHFDPGIFSLVLLQRLPDRGICSASGVLPELSPGSADHSSAQRYKTDWICLERRLP